MDPSEAPGVNLFGTVIPKDVLFAQLFYLLYFASFGSLFPLLAIYFKQLGLSAAQAGILLGSRPLVEFVASPFWGSFADRFRKGKMLLLFSLCSMIVFTLAVGFVQPLTPYCVVLDQNSTGGECKFLVPASEIISGGALGYIKKVAGIGRRRRDILSIIDLSTFDNKGDLVAGKAPEYVTKDKVCNYDKEMYGTLVSPPHSTRVYREQAVEQAFMLLWLLISLGEFFASPALALADGYTLSLVSDTPKDFGKIRLYGSAGWGIAMFLMGIGLDFSDTFRNHPCPTKNTTERNYTLNFVTCTLFALAALVVTTQFKFPQPSRQHRPDEIGGLVMDTRVTEVDPTMAQRTRAKQLNTNSQTEEAPWKSALRAMLKNIHFLAFLLGVVSVGFGAGNIFAFLFWHLQDIGGSPLLFGIASITNHAAEIVTFFYAFRIINNYGYVKVLYMCLGANVFRFLIISWLSNPWLILPLQLLQGAVVSILWASATSYVSIVSPPHLKGTSQHILALLFHGLGRGVGPIIGGFFIRAHGTRALFLLMAFLTLCVLGVYYAVNLKLKNESVKYSGFDAFNEDTAGGETLAPQGLPMLHFGDNKITEAFNQTAVSNQNYGAIEENSDEKQRDDAYDRYVTGH
ncbi:hypothetical protein GPALN_005300 [Globodera pallida]|nr:hypothetical protein GPALN_005300 [Globodera pallida]